MKEQIKQFFKKEWLNVTMYSVITLLLFCCMFWEPMVYVTVVAMVVFCAFRPVQHTFYMIFFAYPFVEVLRVELFGKNFSLYSLFCLLILFVLGVKYLVQVINKRRVFNLYLFILSMCVLLYSYIPFYNLDILNSSYMITIIAGLYLCYEYKKQISFTSLVYITGVALLISCLFSFVAFETPRMLSILKQASNYGYIKFQGVLENPNVLAIINIIVLPCLLVLYLQQHRWYTILLFMANFAFAYMTFSRNFIMCLGFMLPLYAVLELVYYKKKGLLHVACVAVSMLALCAVMFTSTKIYLVRLGILPETSIVQIQQKSDAAVVLPSIPAEPNIPENSVNDEIFVDDPGREGLWERYWQDYTSNWQTILFGRGITYPLLGNADAHQSFIKILWNFGLIGTFLLIMLFSVYLKTIFYKKNTFVLLIVITFLPACFVESLLFNMRSFLLFIFLILAIKEDNSNLGELL